MQYSYGTPATSTTGRTERPPCWGKSFETENRECKQCIYNNSCRQEVLRLSASPRPITTAPQPTAVTYNSQYSQQPTKFFTPPQPSKSYVPTQTQTPAPRSFSPGSVTPPPVVQATGIVPPTKFSIGTLGQYGAAQDPLFHPLWTAPAPFRPQLAGETFIQRFIKNIFLAAMEALGKELVLGVRQMVLAPPPTQNNPTVDGQVVNKK